MGLVMTKRFTECVERVARWDSIHQAKYHSSATHPIWQVAFRDRQEIITQHGVTFRPTYRNETIPDDKPFTVPDRAYRTFLDDILATMAEEH
jgi:hypothetical protein